MQGTRRCKVKIQDSYELGSFHCWSHEANLEQASMLGAPYGQASTTRAIVEFDDGQVELVRPNQIQFIDNDGRKR